MQPPAPRLKPTIVETTSKEKETIIINFSTEGDEWLGKTQNYLPIIPYHAPISSKEELGNEDLNNPTVNISSDKSNVWNDATCDVILEFISVKSTISSGVDVTSYIVVEKLQKLLIRIDFQKDSSRPCIACWVVRPLDNPILECLETMLEDQYEVINQILIFEDNEDSNDDQNS
ncbi:9317_t:CDS:2, partial [Funneliformis caledonium]